MSVRRCSRRSRTGATLLETLISAAILITVLVPVFLLVKSGAGTMRQTGAADSADTRARRAVNRLSRELISCTATSLSAFAQSPNWSTSVTLDQVHSFDAAAGTRTIERLDVRFERDPADADDGVDNDRDGFVDEGIVTMTRKHGTANAQKTVLAQGVAEYLENEIPNGADDNGNGLVDENGFCVERWGSRLTLRLTLQTRTADGEIVRRTAAESLKVRN